MKIQMITIHNIPNYGSAFQAMALNRYLNAMGHECELIDYNPPYFTRGTLKARIGRLLNYSAYKSRTHKYRSFAEGNMRLSKQCYRSFAELKRNVPEADLYVAGGDQLWNEFYDCGRDPSYRLEFTKKDKIAFGTSLGKDSFTEEGLQKLCASVGDYEGIGLREQSGVQLLRSMGLSQVVHVCDPVFLLDRSEYERFVQPVSVNEPYMFVYLVQPSELLDEAVNYIATKLGLKVILSAGFMPKCRCDLHIKELGPEETLSYIKHADFVLSASFHATAFSTMFKKQFATLLPGCNRRPPAVAGAVASGRCAVWRPALISRSN